jgi:hypothetical protein
MCIVEVQFVKVLANTLFCANECNDTSGPINDGEFLE